MAPFSDGIQHHIGKLHFLIVDNEPEGTITEMSESWLQLIASKGLKPDDLTAQSSSKRINELVETFDLESFRYGKLNRSSSKEVYEAKLEMNLQALSDRHSVRPEAMFGRTHHSGEMQVQLRVFEEKYCSGAL